MRWDALFDDLEAQWSAQQAQQLEVEVAEALEAERARLRLADRLRAGVGADVLLRLPGESHLELRLESVGADWLGGRSGSQSLLIPMHAVVSVDGLPQRGQPEVGPTRRRLTIRAPLRALARSREPVLVQGAAGELGRGRITLVGADHFDLAVQGGDGDAYGKPARLRSVALASVAAVRSG